MIFAGSIPYHAFSGSCTISSPPHLPINPQDSTESTACLPVPFIIIFTFCLLPQIHEFLLFLIIYNSLLHLAIFMFKLSEVWPGEVSSCWFLCPFPSFLCPGPSSFVVGRSSPFTCLTPVLQSVIFSCTSDSV